MSAAAPMRLEDRLPGRSGALLWVIAATGVAIGPHLFNQPVWVVLTTTLALAWRGGVHLGRLPMPPRWILVLLTVLMTGLVLGRYGTLFGRDAGVALLVLMTGLKLLETRTYRDAMLVVFLGYFVIITNFFYSQEIPVALYMLVAVFATTAALVRLNAGEAIQPVRESFGLAGLMLGQAVPVMIILFLLFPRLPGPLWGMPQDSTTGVTGLSDSMSPGSISQLLQSDAPAFRVSFTDDPPVPAQRYWRGPVFAHFDGRTWRAGRETEVDALPQAPDLERVVTYTINLEPHERRWLLALDIPVSVPPDARMIEDHYLVSSRPVRRLVQYTLASRTDLILEPELSEARRRQALNLPARAAPRAQALAQDWRSRHEDDEALIRTALGHFNEEPFFYTLSPPRLERDPVDQFLFEARAGFCEHYASAFVVLMRAAGIPARVVTGYQGGEYNRLGNYLLVRQSDAHAWAEVWLQGRGWVRVDPTAAVSPERIESGIRAALSGDLGAPDFIRRSLDWGIVRLQWALWRDSIDYYWSGWVLAFGPERQGELLERLGLGRLDWRGMITLMVALVGVVVLVFAAIFLWRNRLPVADPLAVVYRHFCRRLARGGLTRAPHEPPMDFARRIARERPELAEPVMAFTREYVALRYGASPDPERFGRLRGLLRRIRV
ncbi:transglutaminase TgpA family protein [Ectothiorhodospira lacustris]|uniref:transglutaminase TgpA family protein n=1 Tax=Ectothiorhodospira lacustris TaxID=2899127 RepID=UPI001EE828AC|nr:DUF3488 and transglutaminase-like domain-containing protein [Ectothiorhodospira lacustris]MCG5509975.1 DUF3488 and transglutaminase-like domain-containing protein [Ectothiorhodospira lacustris]MCG5521721.1 DUF3488 and transglutaminase-like domain-containing protein [Ectothiorhodospira lacustris]